VTSSAAIDSVTSSTANDGVTSSAAYDGVTSSAAYDGVTSQWVNASDVDGLDASSSMNNHSDELVKTYNGTQRPVNEPFTVTDTSIGN